MFSLESPYLGDSNEYTQYTVFNTNREITLNYPKSAAMGCETAMVNEPSVLEPLKFYCIVVLFIGVPAAYKSDISFFSVFVKPFQLPPY